MPVFPISGSDFECHIYETQRIGTVGDPSAPTGPGFLADIRRVNGEKLIHIPGRFVSFEEAKLAALDYLKEHFPGDVPD